MADPRALFHLGLRAQVRVRTSFATKAQRK